MSVLALKSIVGALPSPSVLVFLDGVQEVQASNDGVRHVFSPSSGVSVHVDGFVRFLGLRSFGTLDVLHALEQTRH